MRIYALTGGIAAGKSEASRRFVQQGIPVIDADEVAHDAIGPGGSAERGVIEAFGSKILTHGKIDREKLGQIVFSDKAELARLNGLVHPGVLMEIASRCAQLANEGCPAAIVDAALHAENGKLGPGMESLILVTSPRSERVKRMMANRGMSEEDSNSRIDAQTPPERKAPLARWIIDNSGGLDALYRQVDAVAEELKQNGHVRQ